MAANNEETTLRRCVDPVLTAPLPDGLIREIILVDDGSTDSTWEIAQELARRHPELKIVQQPKNQGKGAAIRRAIAEMTGDLTIFQDADLEYDPRDRKSTRLNSSHLVISYAVFCLKKKKHDHPSTRAP